MDDDDVASHSRLRELSRSLSRTDDRPLVSSQVHDAAPAICRICRGEGTATEPLFYPCKCSGSIKYVHQECLMEWLSHSQKKYCELCKTSFRFTKLYAPDMPQSLPIHIFLQHVFKYIFQNVLVWLRAALAFSVWVFWLPYFMRSVWSFMFWISDEGLGNTSILSRTNTSSASAEFLSSTLLDVGTCPASPLLDPTTTSTTAAQAVLDGVSGQNISDFILRMLLSSLGVPTQLSPSEMESEIAANVSAAQHSASSSSFLSDVEFLRKVARTPALHRTLVSVLEGQMITVLVIVSFILIILVRDYVVQQQPDANMRAAFPAVEEAPPAPEAVPVEIQQHHELEPLGVPNAESDEETLDDGDASPEGNEPTGATLLQTANDAETQTGTGETEQEQRTDADMDDRSTYRRLDNSRLNPTIGSANGNTDDRASVVDYLRIYRQADGDPDRIVQIAEREGLREKLDYWIDMTFKERERANARRAPPLASQTLQPRPESRDSTEEGSSSAAFTPTSSERSQNNLDDLATSGEGKGKEKEWLPPSSEAMSPSPSFHAEFSTGPSRSRALSDGPLRTSSVNPLANNSWSFAGLPQEANNEDSLFVGDNAESSARVSSTPIDTADGPGLNVDMPSPALPNEIRVGDIRVVEPDELNPTEEMDAQTAQVVEHGLGEERAGPEEPADLVGRVTNFMWGTLDEHQIADNDAHNDDELAAGDDAHDDAWVDEPLADAPEDVDADNMDDIDGEPGPALDQEAVEDMEDFEGVMELIGMRGPIAGLFQNAIFCAVLVSVTIFACTFLPYNIGRVSVWIMANPIRLVRMLFELSKLVQDATILLGGFCSWCLINMVDIFTGPIGGVVAKEVVSVRKASWNLFIRAGSRIFGYVADFPLSANEIQNFSAISHEALNTVKGRIGNSLTAVEGGFSRVLGGSSPEDVALWATITSTTQCITSRIAAVGSALVDPSSWVIDLRAHDAPPVIKPELASWSSLDRFWAILAGYVTIFIIGAMYLKRGSPFARDNMIHGWEAAIIDVLHQASGIMKVILIISIEMLVFPLYCGLLLDAALLPLFEGATFKSRMLFTYNYPLTSVFVHWFVGTGYMFHFALFVSMCRKIMRPGVLCKFFPVVHYNLTMLTEPLADFIRDPDDPEFHPIRDVLDRNLTTQLRKILFSAFVYGALVIVCLGGVVWGLALAISSVLPIHYSSNEPVLEFPVDLLFYNFLMPLAVKFFKPSDGLQIMYTWWFRKCARALRLTYFLFGERRIDEEGLLQLAADSPDHRLPSYRKLLLELDDDDTRVIPKTWRDTFEGGDAKPNPSTTATELKAQRQRKMQLVNSGQLEKDGRFVRAPASDRIKIPKGRQVFLPVSERNHRKDGNPDSDLYGSPSYQMVYVPPNFRARIFLFILFIWIFAAVTGVGFTIVPLVFGRTLFKVLIPEHIRTNDIYAFSIGIYVLGSVAYSLIHLQRLYAKVQNWVHAAQRERAEGHAGERVAGACIRAAKLLYAYFFILVVFPLLLAAVLELYLSIPLNTYMNPPTAASIAAARDETGVSGRHTIRVMQVWTLGLLYLKLGARAITYLVPESRLAVAVRTVLRRGWMRPNISVLTRAFVVPGLSIAAIAILGPPAITHALIKNGVFASGQPIANEAAEAARMAIIYRQAYPVAVLCALLVRNAVRLVKVFNGWTARIRDEAYLIGERLHNFGAATAGARKGRGGAAGAWRARGARL
ncbi:ERAD-associated E3 ubiquitin-protein ligase doa10 [Paramyrothecium foliicola]|nr:ERAD-associated E3 ubiquitin-protein ligase doa10 [Paramyrothecium foliicola]